MPTSPTSGPGGGSSYTPPTTRADYGGAAVNIADGGAANLTWDVLNVGTELFDRSNLGSPTVLTAGVYSVAVLIFTAILTINGHFSLNLILDAGGDDVELTGIRSPVSTAAMQDLTVTTTATYYLPAGAIVRAAVSNNDGVAARNFALDTAVVQRIS